MKTLNVMLSNLGGRVVPIGYEGENLYTRIRINCIEVFSEYPDATVSMVVSPPDGEMYPAVVEKSGVMVIWDITDSVLSSNGSGECQLTFTEGDVVRKSVVFGISINRSLVASGEAPEPVQEWIDRAEQTAQEIAENAAMLAKQDIVESYGEIAPAIIETASGAIASFSDGADGMLVKTLEVQIDPVQEGSGDPSPENVRPISGWDSANVSRTGVNVWDEETQVGYWNATTGVYIQSAGQLCSKNYISVKPNTTYRNYKGATTNQGELIFFDADKGFISSKLPSAWINKEFTTPNNCYFIQFNLGGSYGETYNHDISINYPATDTQYHAYSGSTAEYEFPEAAGTVYGGTLTIHQDGSGELVVDHFLYEYDGTETFSKSGTALNGFYNQLTGGTIPHNWPKMLDYNQASTYTDEKSSMFILTRNANTYKQNYGYCLIDSGHNFDVPPETFGTTVESFKAKLAELYAAGTPVSVFCKIATPVTYQLTNQQVIALLKGSNNVWADTGNVALEYPADTKLYIDGKVAELQALILENISNS